MSADATIVLGLGRSGYSCIRHLAAGGEPLKALDTRPDAPFLDAVRRRHPEVELLAPRDWPDALRSARRVIASPGIAPEHPLLRAAAAAGVPVGSDIELFLRAAAAPVAGITGTNGKSTATTLAGALLRANGLRAAVGGNLGTPALDLLDEPADAYVLELSSFQLERLARPALAAACVLNISPDHLDRHGDFAAYAAAKRRIYAGAAQAVYDAQQPLAAPPAGYAGRVLALNGDANWRLDGDALILGGARHGVRDLALQGRHNHCNALAAAAIASRLAPLDDLAPLFEAAPLPHRAAPVACIGGVDYIDDSKATNVGAACAALAGFGAGRNIVLIAGGDAKGAAFDALAPLVARHAAQLILVGRDAALLGDALAGSAPIDYARDMRDAVARAARCARPGQIVLLSPGCASFDAYPDYRARGRDFAAAVQALRAGP